MSDPDNSFIGGYRTITPQEMGLEETKLKKEFRERLLSYIFSAVFLVFFIILIMVFAGVAMLFGNRDFSQITEYWKWVIPLATTFIGYAIGRGPKDAE
ncbi:hypothetical protein [Pseudomonas syringae]|uniref:hypothetical protein n=1 Tax=Pseudomonas syringae TaxID=317 RepID=UPI0032D8BBEF